MSADKVLKVDKVPTDELALQNCVVLNPEEIPGHTNGYVKIVKGSSPFFYNYEVNSSIPLGFIGFNAIQRKWMGLALKEDLKVSRVTLPPAYAIGNMVVEVEFLKKGTTSKVRHDQNDLKSQVLSVFLKHAFMAGQLFSFEFKDKEGEKMNLIGTVREMTAIDVGLLGLKGGPGEGAALATGIVVDATQIKFKAVEGSGFLISGGDDVPTPIFDLGKTSEIGGLDKELNLMFRRAFASRMLPLETVEKLGMKHCKGIMLYGPPGTGKTLIARQIGKMLLQKGREPKLVKGPEILNKYVGESEAAIRKLFEDAENEYKAKGDMSGLHVIIFDEIDSICKSRGSVQGGTGVNDSVVNQLLTKIDGPESLNNILVIGMTNRIDLIDEALLRSGRMELKIQISLPDEAGRVQILQIHTRKMKNNGMLGEDVDLQELAAMCKNFSGAELQNLVEIAISFASFACIDPEKLTQVDRTKLNSLKVTRQYFLQAFQEIKPTFGVSEKDLDGFVLNGIVNWSDSVQQILADGSLFASQTKHSESTPLVSVLFAGMVGAGKTALAATLARNSGFPFVKVISPENMVGYSEVGKCHAITKVFDDAYKSMHSIIIVDDIERLLEYVPIGPRFSNAVLQTLLVLLKKKPADGHKLLILATTSEKEVMDQMGILKTFSSSIHVPYITKGDDIMNALYDMKRNFESKVADAHRKFLEEVEKSKVAKRPLPSPEGPPEEFFSDSVLEAIGTKLKGSTQVSCMFGSCDIFIGIKRLYMVVEMARQETPDHHAEKFIDLLFEACRFDKGI